MKNIIKCLIALLSIFATSCSDDVKDREAVTESVAPTLVSPTSLNMILNHDTPNDAATTLVWNDASYNGTATTINYSIEFDTAGTNFLSPTTVATTTDKFKNFTVGELNQAALDAGFVPFVESSIDVRIKSSVGNSVSLPLTSNFITITLTPYPAWPNWGILGDATPTGWGVDTNMDYDLSTHLYSITIHLTAGGGYKFRLDDGWSVNFGDNGNNLTLDPGGDNIPVSVTGDYKIVANFGAELTTPSNPVAFPAKSYTVTLQ